MKTTADFDAPAPYLGADLTDRHSRGRRPIDVCGLWPAADGRLAARFWTWTWPEAAQPLRVEAIAAEIRAARSVMLDAPQGLAAPGRPLRAAERECRTAAKSPDRMPDIGKPYAGYVRSSVELFAALHASGIRISPDDCLNGACEYYPGDAWKRLVDGKLPNKARKEGRRLRREVLAALGVTGLPDCPSHDENDACLGAVLAAAAGGHVPGLSVELIGEPLMIDADDILREGPIVVPRVDPALGDRIAASVSPRMVPPAKPRKPPATSTGAGSTPENRSELVERAEHLFSELVQNLRNGKPRVYTYSGAYARITRRWPQRWSQANSSRVLAFARATKPRAVPGLGYVRLDTFIVAKKSGEPAKRHWDTAGYSRDDWRAVFATARLMK